MREFFRGWRRKAGCISLVMALALMGVWIRSLSVMDLAIIAFGQRAVSIGSFYGVVTPRAALERRG